MSDITRFGVSLEQSLLDKFDRLISQRDYTNRSEAIRDLIRQELIQIAWDEGEEVAGAITIVYDHDVRELNSKLIDIQHGFLKIIISTQHVHLDNRNCLEIIAVKGPPGDVRRLSNSLKALKGVKHGALSISFTGRSLA